MTQAHQYIMSIYSGYDPTRTMVLRDRFAKAIKKRFRALRGVIYEAIVHRDCFGLTGGNMMMIQEFTPPAHKAFNFPRSDQKVAGFMNWLQGQIDRGVLETTTIQQVGESVESAWTNTYISDSYKRGVIRARSELGKAGFQVPSMESTGGISASMSTPFHMDRLGLLYTRTFNELKGITDGMGQIISRELAQGIADGDNPRLLARKLNAVISGNRIGELGLTDRLGRFIPAERRAEILARTEIVRAHHQATMQEYKNWRVEGVRVKAEWLTAGDNRVCSRCESWEMNTPKNGYPIEQIENLIPLHPQCRCIALPMMPVEGEEGQRATQSESRDLFEEEKRALKDYRAASYKIINKSLREGKEITDEYYKKTLINLASAINHSPKYKGVSYRGITFSTVDDYNKFIGNANSGNYVFDKAFMSSTKSTDIAGEFYSMEAKDARRVMLKIEAAGKNGIDLNKALSIPEGIEQEVLFDKGTKFKVKSRKIISELIDR